LTVHRVGTQVKRATSGACALLFVFLLAAAGAQAAQADSFTWLGPTSLITTGGNKALTNVSCTSTGQPGTSQCTTVDASGQEVTFDSATGTIISRQTVDLGPTVSAVSCPSSAQCFAVDNGGNELAFNPQTGATIEAGLNHIDASGLTALSCTSGTACVAVDAAGSEFFFNPNSNPEVNATHGTIDGSARLNAVACPIGGSTCTAVDGTGNEITFTPGISPAPASVSIDGSHALKGVACPAATTCTAVDGLGNEVSFDPTSGTLIGSGTQIDSTGGALTGVSCPMANQCAAVDSLGNEVTYAPTSTPGAAVHGIDQAGISNVPLIAVSCPAGTTACAAVDNRSQEVGFTPSGTFTTPQPVASPSLSGIACPSRTQCTAIESGSTEVTFDPTTGAVNSAGVADIDTTNNALTGIACVSITECTAVDGGGNEITFDPTTGQQKSGGFLSLEAVPATSVACLTISGSSQCTMVDTSGNQVTFLPDPPNPEIDQNSPVLEDPGAALQSVACPSATQCTAVDAAGREVTFTPKSGIASTPGSIDSGSGDSLLSVACPSTTQCTATDRGGNVISFTASPAAQPSNISLQDLEGVGTSISVNAIACPTTTQCTAVDGIGEEATFDPTSTTLDPSLLIPIAGANALNAVACQSTSICAAVDADGDGFEGVVPPADTSAPTVSGTASEHQRLTQSNGAWTNVPTGFTHQWEDCTSPTDTSTCTPIAGAIADSYTPIAADIGQYVRVREIASNAGGPGTAALSAATAQVTPAPPTNAAPPTIAGVAQQAQTLSDQNGNWNEDAPAPLSFAYQWEDCDGQGANCAAIAGATASTYTPTTSDIGHTLIVLETAANSGGSGAPAASAPTAAVVSAPPPPVQASTQAAKPVLVTSATLHAVLVTQGVAVSWQFVYGTSTHYDAGTPVQTIAAGGGSTVSVSQLLRNLKPGTKYHFRVDETAAATQFAPATTVFGHDMTFTTPSTGKITLVHTRLTVSPSGSVAVPIFCQSPLACVGRFSISTSAIIGHGANRRSARVLCNTSSIRVGAEHKQNIDVTVSNGCRSLLASAGSHQIKGTFTTRPRSGQHGLVEPIVLASAPSKRRPSKAQR
jgi:hypothetical protein